MWKCYNLKDKEIALAFQYPQYPVVICKKQGQK